MKLPAASLAIAASLAFPSVAHADTVELTRLIEVSFTGTVIENGEGSLQVRLSDGTLVPYNGPLPQNPYAIGDTVTFTYGALVPTQAFYDPSIYAGPAPQDGLYDVTVRPAFYSGGLAPGGAGNVTSFDLSGEIDPTLNFGQPPNLVMTLQYDFDADRYYIDGDGGFLSGAYEGPGYYYDAALDTYVLCNVGTGSPQCNPSAAFDTVNFNLIGDGADTIRTNLIPVLTTDPFSGEGTGFFEYIFGNGSWSLPQLSSRNSTPVPGPGMLVLFGLGALGTFSLGRRKSARA